MAPGLGRDERHRAAQVMGHQSWYLWAEGRQLARPCLVAEVAHTTRCERLCEVVGPEGVALADEEVAGGCVA